MTDAGISERGDSVRRRRAGADLMGRLADFGRRRRAVARMRGWCWMAALAGLGLLAAAWVDLLVDLPPALRLAGVAAALLGSAGAFAAAALKVRRSAMPAPLARDVDRLAGAGGQVSAGLDLTEMPSAAAPLSRALAGIAVQRASDVVRSLPEDAVEPLRTLGRALAGLLLVMAAFAAFGLLGARAFSTEFARLVDPFGDHPAYSRYAFTVRPGDTKVVYGDGLAIKADVAGPPLERLSLMLRQPDGSEQALPMFGERTGSWRVHLTELTEPLTYWVSAGRARSPRYRVGVITTPRIEQLTVRIEPPAYTNLPPAEGAMPDGGISGLPGARVTLTACSNRPLASARLLLDLADGTQRTLSGAPGAADPKSAGVEFAIEQPGTLRLWVVDVDGQRSAAEIKAPILLLKDERPFVRITQPMPESFATPDVPLPVSLDAEDDYGVSALSLYRALNGSRHLPEKLLAPLPAEPKLQASAVLNLGSYGLEPGDQITLFGRAEDTDPAGAKGAESSTVRVSIISRALYDELMRARQTAEDFERKYDEAARRMEGLRDAADALAEEAAAEADKGGQCSAELKQKMAEFARKAAEAARATREAAEAEPLYALDQDLSKDLQQLADAISAAGQRAQDAAGAASAREAGQDMEMAAALLGEAEQAYQQGVTEPLERFMKAYALAEMEERFVALAAKQRDLATRSDSLKGQDKPGDPALKARMRDLADEQRALQEELKTVLQEIRNRAEALPDDDVALTELKDTALQFADAVEASRAGTAQAEAAQALQGFEGTQADEHATEAADVLESFIAQAQQRAGQAMLQGRLVFQPAHGASAATTMSQLLAAAGLGDRPGVGQGGIGSGAGGYSTRAAGLRNVGLYGPSQRRGGGGLTDREQAWGGLPGESVGGAGVGGITLAPSAPAGGEALPLQALPARYRDGVRAYFRRVAEEASAGALIENDKQQPERGTR